MKRIEVTLDRELLTLDRGEQAVKEGLIDSLGGLCDALDAIKQMAEKENSDT